MIKRNPIMVEVDQHVTIVIVNVLENVWHAMDVLRRNTPWWLAWRRPGLRYAQKLVRAYIDENRPRSNT